MGRHGETTIKSIDIANAARVALTDRKGEDIALLDLRELSSLTDYAVLVSGSSPPHLKGLFQYVEQALKEQGARCFRKAGTPDSGWIVMDYIDVVIHIFETPRREYYAIEELWAGAPRLE